MEHLGFIFDIETMTIFLPAEKVTKITGFALVEKASQIKQLGSITKGTSNCTNGSRCCRVGRLGGSFLQRRVLSGNVVQAGAGQT